MNAQAKKSLTDDSSPVDNVGKVFAGLLVVVHYLWCTLFEISGVPDPFCNS